MVSHGCSLHTEIRRGGRQGFKWTANIIDNHDGWQCHCGLSKKANTIKNHHVLALIDHLIHKQCINELCMLPFSELWGMNTSTSQLHIIYCTHASIASPIARKGSNIFVVWVWEKQVLGNGTLMPPPPGTHLPLLLIHLLSLLLLIIHTHMRSPCGPNWSSSLLTNEYSIWPTREVFHPTPP